MCTLIVGHVQGCRHLAVQVRTAGYKNSVDGRVYFAECWIIMSVILNHKLGVQGAMGIPRMCAQPVGNIQSSLVCSCTGPYRMCTKILWTAECSMISGELT